MKLVLHKKVAKRIVAHLSITAFDLEMSHRVPGGAIEPKSIAREITRLRADAQALRTAISQGSAR